MAADEKALKKGDLQKSYNAASGVLEELKALHDQPGSKLRFATAEQGDVLIINTNIPADPALYNKQPFAMERRPEGIQPAPKTVPVYYPFLPRIEKEGDLHSVSVIVEPNGRIRLHDIGTTIYYVKPYSKAGQLVDIFSSRRKSATKKALAILDTKARQAGLLPK